MEISVESLYARLGLNRLSPKTDQNHFSPDDTNTQSR